MDSDVAQEAALTRTQILQQAGAAEPKIFFKSSLAPSLPSKGEWSFRLPPKSLNLPR